jgi:type III secretory pathway component EscU
MDTSCFVPFPHCIEEIIRHLLKTCPIQIALLREIVLIAVFATKITKVGDMPLDIELFFH